MASSITPRVVPAKPAGDETFDSAAYARRIIRDARTAALATTDSETGFPFLSSITTSTNRKGKVLFLTSLVASHSRNMRHDARVAVMFQIDESDEEWAAKRPMFQGRLTLSGKAHVTDDATDIEDFLKAHKKLTIAVKQDGFAIWKLDPMGVDMMAGPRLAPELSIEHLSSN
ncbi:MAG: pyridoxamine 5'-phosphate oxidase family protein [Sneathiella sp.]